MRTLTPHPAPLAVTTLSSATPRQALEVALAIADTGAQVGIRRISDLRGELRPERRPKPVRRPQ